MNMAYKLGSTPLHEAVFQNPQIALALLENGAHVDAQDYFGQTPLNTAVKSSTFEIVSILLYYGADATIPCDCHLTPFMASLISKDLDMQEQLIEYETDFNRVNTEGKSMLFLAVTYESPYVAEIVHRGGDINDFYDQQYLLMLSVYHNNLDFLKILLDEIDYEEASGNSDNSLLSLKICFERASSPTIMYLMENDKAKDIIPYMDKRRVIYTLLKRLEEISKEDIMKVIYILLCYGAEPEYIEVDRVFVAFGDSQLFRVLLHMDIKPSMSDIYLFEPNYYLLPRIIYHIMPTENVKDIIDDFVRDICYSNYCKGDPNVNIRQIFNYCVNSQFYQWYVELCESFNYHIDKVVLKKLDRKVSSLLELSRNATRFAICSKFNMKSSRQFYTYVHWMEISSVLKKIITFETKIYS